MIRVATHAPWKGKSRESSRPWRPLTLLLALGLNLMHPAAARAAAGVDLFESVEVSEIQLMVSTLDMERLRSKPRSDVPARVRCNSSYVGRASLHVKGRRGSLRTLDEKPSLTLSFEGTASSPRFHGLLKFHLNNSVEDPSYLNEWVGSEVFRAAGQPAPRVAHARVTLNGRSLGLFVLKEGMTEDFLRRTFDDPNCVVYEPGIGHDLDEQLDSRPRRLPQGWPTPALLAQALQESSVSKRLELTERWMDVDKFMTFMALEVITGHRDGYCLARNNFRLCYAPRTKQFSFVPQGMDVLFGTPDLVWKPEMAGLAARSLMKVPALEVRYRNRFIELLSSMGSMTPLLEGLDRQRAKLEDSVQREEREAFQEASRRLQGNLVKRRESLQSQLAADQATLPAFSGGTMELRDWTPRNPPDGGSLGRVEAHQREITLHIQAGPKTSASWRTQLRLPPGHYEFTAEVRTSGVRPLPFGERQGAGLRLAGREERSAISLSGDVDWTRLTVEFNWDGQGVADLLCELRASSGDAWFDLSSLRLRQTPVPAK